MLILLTALADPGPPAATAAVVASAAQPVVEAPSGKARARALLAGQNAWFGELWLEPDAKVPEHRDSTEEYLLVLEGSGKLVIDGVHHDVAPGTAILMPANAAVSYTNGPARFHAVQVFAGPEPAKKYTTWKPAAP
ncbi:MAG: cupin domain-containing protein [Alphaproteobacteria bacterium]|nr:cupin domain-containing protein [Alphaproteobacteria bacterium]